MPRATHPFRPISDEDYDSAVEGLAYPHRASVAWDDYAALLPERELWRGTRWAYVPDEASAGPQAVLTLREFHIHAMPFLWAEGSPVWVDGDPTPQQEQGLVDALRSFVIDTDSRPAFLRLAVLHHEDVRGIVPTCQQLYAHDSTIIIDTTGTEEDLRARMKKRGRRDVNKAGRECRAVIAEETGIERDAFDELIAIMHETSSRQGFADYDADYYWTFFSTFRDQGMARLFVGREDGTAVNWGLFLVRDGFATYEIAASNEEARRSYAPDLTLYTGLLALQADGVRAVDLVAVGSEYNPVLNTLNGFKTKWTQEITRVPAPMELVLKPLRYRALNAVAGLRERRRAGSGRTGTAPQEA